MDEVRLLFFTGDRFNPTKKSKIKCGQRLVTNRPWIYRWTVYIWKWATRNSPPPLLVGVIGSWTKFVQQTSWTI